MTDRVTTPHGAPWAPPTAEPSNSPAGDAASDGTVDASTPADHRHDGPGVATARGDAPRPSEPRPVDAASVFGTLRPLGPGVVLDGAFGLLRSRFRLLLALAVCLYVPIRILDLVTMIWSGDVQERYHVGPTILLLGGDSGWSWVVVGLQSFALSVLGLCIGSLALRLAEGEDPTFRDLAGLAVRRGWVALLIVPIGLVIRAPLSCIPLGYLLGDTLVFLSSVVAGAEGSGPWRSVRRSISLTKHSYGPMLAVTLGGLVISQMLRISFTTGPILLASTFSTSDTVLTAVSQAGALVVLVAEPLTACIAARAYLELRCRNEGYDLRNRMHERFGVAATAPAPDTATPTTAARVPA